MAWLLTEEGSVSGVFGDRRASRGDSIWEITYWVTPKLVVDAKNLVGRIAYGPVRVYHTETGEVLQPVDTVCHSHSLRLAGVFRGRDYNGIDWCETLCKPSQRTSRVTLREGWAEDSEGRRRLWVPVEWRKSWDGADWVGNTATQFSIVEGRPVIIKF